MVPTLALFVLFVFGVVAATIIIAIVGSRSNAFRASSHSSHPVEATMAGMAQTVPMRRLMHGDIEAWVNQLVIPQPNGTVHMFYEFRLPWPDPEQRVEIFPEDVRTPPRHRPGMSTVSAVSPGVQRQFVVQASDGAHAQRLLNNDVQQRIQRIYRYQGTNDIGLWIGGGQFLLRKFDVTHRMQDMSQVAQLVFGLYDDMRVLEDADIQYVKLTLNERQIVCEICGEVIVEDMVECFRCGTPHHRDCWEYYGACSVYACGETKCTMATNQRNDRASGR